MSQSSRKQSLDADSRALDIETAHGIQLSQVSGSLGTSGGDPAEGLEVLLGAQEHFEAAPLARASSTSSHADVNLTQEDLLCVSHVPL